MATSPIAAGKSSFDLIDREKLLAELPIKEGITLLDVACGVGNYSLALSKYIGDPGRIYAVDLWKEGISALQEQIIAQGTKNIQASVADVSKKIPVEDNSIDVCLMATVLHDLIQDKTDEGTLTGVQRTLKPGGTLAIIEFKKINGRPGPPIGIRLSPNELENILDTYGFQEMKTIDIGPYNYLALFTYEKES